MKKWTDDEWDIVLACQRVPHAAVWSNHALRYEPTLCDDCKELLRKEAQAAEAAAWRTQISEALGMTEQTLAEAVARILELRQDRNHPYGY